MGAFKQWDETKSNILNDSDYAANATRSGGIGQNVRVAAASNLHNKLYYQITTFIKAFADMLAGKGYTITDDSISTLVTALIPVQTKTDIDARGFITSAEALAAIAAATTPSGSIIARMSETVPSGWLECDGAQYTAGQYPALIAVLGNRFGGNGTSTFNVPDLRGMFLRGWNHNRVDSFADPDWNLRTLTPSGSITVGSTQQFNQKVYYFDHKHNVLDMTLNYLQIPPHTHGGVMRYPGGMVEQNQEGGPQDYSNYNQATDSTGGAYSPGGQAHNHGLTSFTSAWGDTNGIVASISGKESRPNNMAVMYIIKI